ncbi:hypothetical protein ACFUTU_12885 [Arthrobacter sp. NPDC057388]|uniref:hypothetical protein n=1 Tax=Arthrobacter sp. NPDC057388 TaxID=3346116 RepID=UPI003642B4A9
MTDKAEPRRLRWSVPRADESTNRWLDEQYDISRSLQLLIRESIQRDGYIDVVNRPVEQLPRRGRPPQGEQDPGRTEDQAQDDEGQNDTDSQGESRDEAAVPVAASSEPVQRVETAQAVQPPPAPPVREPHPVPASEPSVPSGLDAFLTR